MIDVIKNLSLNAFTLGYLPMIAKRDVIILQSGVCPDIDMQSELDGDTNTLARLALLSKDKESVVVAQSGVTADGGYYNSAVLLDCGKLAGVSDEISPLRLYDKGSCLRCYNTSRGRIGIIIGGDILYCELWARLAVCAPSMIIALCPDAPVGLFSSLATLCNCNVCALTRQCAAMYSGNGILVKSGYEDCTRLPVPESARCAKVLLRKIRTSIE